jgi:hypothetical protein
LAEHPPPPRRTDRAVRHAAMAVGFWSFWTVVSIKVKSKKSLQFLKARSGFYFHGQLFAKLKNLRKTIACYFCQLAIASATICLEWFYV